MTRIKITESTDARNARLAKEARKNEMKLSTNAKKAVKHYGAGICKKAYELHCKGEGARTIALTVLGLGTTNQADAAINAGRELMTIDSVNNRRFCDQFSVGE